MKTRHIEFLRDFDWRPSESPRSVLAYKAGKRYFVRAACAVEALARGAAVPVARAPAAKPVSTLGLDEGGAAE